MKLETMREKSEFRNRIYAIIYWTSLAMILLWYILKSTGVIGTPLWLELLPVAFAIFGAGAFMQRINSGIETLKTDVSSLKKDFSILNVRTDHLEQDMHYVKAQF